MATYHCKLNKGKYGSCLQHANYILREGRYSAEQSGREDLIYKESGNLPEWANSPQEFWKAAGTYERVNGVAYYELEIALPNELTDEENVKLVQEYVQKVIGEKPYTFAIHNKPAALKEEVQQPHAHIMFSERVAQKDVVYTKEQFFKRYNSRYPERGGAKKDNRFIVYGTEIMYKVRKDLKDIINKNYERKGLAVRVSADTLEKLYHEAVAKNDVDLARYYDREAEKHIGPVEVQKIKKGIEGLKTTEEKEKFYIEFASDKALHHFYTRQCKEAAAELVELNKERELLHKQMEEIQKQMDKVQQLPAKVEVKIVAEDATALVNNYIKVLTAEQDKARDSARKISRFILSDKRMLMYAQSVYTKGESKKIVKEINEIKRIEKKYLEAVSAWEKSKPTGLNPVVRYKYFQEEARLQKWKADIDQRKAVNQEKIKYINKELHKPEAHQKIIKMVEKLQYKNSLRMERYKNFNEHSKQLNNQIALCYGIRTKLWQFIYDKEHKLSVPDKIYQSVKTGNIAQVQNIINELRSAVNKLETNYAHGSNNGHFLSRSYDERDKGGLER